MTNARKAKVVKRTIFVNEPIRDLKKIYRKTFTNQFYLPTAVSERVASVCDQAVNTSNSGFGGSSLAHRVVSLDKERYSTLTLFAEVYKWVPVRLNESNDFDKNGNKGCLDSKQTLNYVA